LEAHATEEEEEEEGVFLWVLFFPKKNKERKGAFCD
jgi:hypothetical protein